MDTITPGYSFGMRLGYVREGQGLTKKAMAESLGISPSTWSRYEADRTYPTVNILKKLYELYNVREDWLMGNIGDTYY